MRNGANGLPGMVQLFGGLGKICDTPFPRALQDCRYDSPSLLASFANVQTMGWSQMKPDYGLSVTFMTVEN